MSGNTEIATITLVDSPQDVKQYDTEEVSYDNGIAVHIITDHWPLGVKVVNANDHARALAAEHTARVEADGKLRRAEARLTANELHLGRQREAIRVAERERDELRVTRDKAVDLWKTETNVALRLRAELAGRVKPPFYADVVGELEKRERKLKAELQLVTAPQPEREKFYRDRIAELEEKVLTLNCTWNTCIESIKTQDTRIAELEGLLLKIRNSLEAYTPLIYDELILDIDTLF